MRSLLHGRLLLCYSYFMDLIRAQAKAVSEMQKHGLMEKGWSFEFDRATSRLGLCNFTKKKITISKYFTGAATEDEFEQNLFHEIAHALLPVAAKHGWEWKRKAKELGYRGGRTSRNPYHEQKLKEQSVAFMMLKPLPDEPLSAAPVPKILVSTRHLTVTTLSAEDILILPNGMKLKVTEVTDTNTKALEDGTGSIWTLSNADALNYLRK